MKTPANTMQCKNLRKLSASPFSACLLYFFLPVWLLISVPLIMSMKLIHRLKSLFLRQAEKPQPPSMRIIRSPMIKGPDNEYEFIEDEDELDRIETAIWLEAFKDPFILKHITGHLERCHQKTSNFDNPPPFDDPLY